MQVVVKKPHIRVEGDITGNLMEYLQREFNDIEIIRDEDDELVEICKSDWHRSIRPTISPGENVRTYRELHNLTQKELGEKVGNLSRQNISNIENNRRPISKTVAKKLAEIFNIFIEKFL